MQTSIFLSSQYISIPIDMLGWVVAGLLLLIVIFSVSILSRLAPLVNPLSILAPKRSSCKSPSGEGGLVILLTVLAGLFFLMAYHSIQPDESPPGDSSVGLDQPVEEDEQNLFDYPVGSKGV